MFNMFITFKSLCLNYVNYLYIVLNFINTVTLPLLLTQMKPLLVPWSTLIRYMKRNETACSQTNVFKKKLLKSMIRLDNHIVVQLMNDILWSSQLAWILTVINALEETDFSLSIGWFLGGSHGQHSGLKHFVVHLMNFHS